ncbi:uncharacterized protein LOC131191056 [Ahaetulla prasina]|uniref:uncharacterized protein LOC131191056 n=1 Tax=Ahaetulla prasina TaxID=499056 RepID=UPI002648893C|nr:uncharacterized protein LOC131191056 [Ahaetulla prasina]
MESNPRPEGSEPPHSLQAVQDAVTPVHLGEHQGGGLPHVSRPDGGILTCPYPSGSQTIPPLLPRGSPLPILCPSIRALLGPQGLLKANGRSHSAPPGYSNQNPSLSGRSPYPISNRDPGGSGFVHNHSGSRSPRLLDQQGQKSLTSYESNPTLRGHHRHDRGPGLSVTGASHQFTEPSQGGNQETSYSFKDPFPTLGETGLLHRHCTLGSSPLQDTAVVSTPLSKGTHSYVTNTCPTSTTSQALPSMVDLPSPVKGQRVQGTPTPNLDNRCQSSRLGRPSGIEHGSGSVVPRGPDPQHKLVRTQGHSSGLTIVPGHCSQSRHSNINGQCGRKGSCEPPGGNPLSASLARGSATGSLGGGSPEVHTGLSYIRGGKHTGRLAQPSLSRPGGVATESGYVPRDHTPLREPAGRPLCHSRQSSTGSVLLKVPSPGGGGHRRPVQSLAPWPPLCLPSHSNNTQGYQEDAEGTGGTHLAGSTLASAPVVCGPGGSLSGSPVETSSDQDLAQPRAADSSGPSVVQADRLALERSLLRKRHVPANVANTIQASRRSSTIRIYGSTWRTFYTWCSSKNIDPTTASTITILIFLQHGLEQGLAANTLRRQLSASVCRIILVRKLEGTRRRRCFSTSRLDPIGYRPSHSHAWLLVPPTEKGHSGRTNVHSDQSKLQRIAH